MERSARSTSSKSSNGSAAAARVRDAIWFEEEGSLQQGGQATIYKGTYNGRPAAIKVMSAEKRHRHVELRALQTVGAHPHVIHWHAAHSRADGSFLIALELAHCDLLEVLHSSPRRGLGTGHRVREWMLQVASALAHMHGKGVAHRDLKPENLLLCSQGEPHVGSAGSASTPAGSRLPPLAPGLQGATTTDTRLWSAAATAGRGNPKSPLAASAPAAQTVPQGGPGGASKADVLAEVHGSTLAPGRPIVKVCDFGYSALAREAGGPVHGYSPVGSMRYGAPEVYARHLIFTDRPEFDSMWGAAAADALQAAPYDACAADVWSFGVTLYVLVFGAMPFKAAYPGDKRYRSFVTAAQPGMRQQAICSPGHAAWSAATGQRTWSWPQPGAKALHHLISRCMAVLPENRPSFAAVVNHPWFSTPDWDPAAETEVPAASPGAGVPRGAARRGHRASAASSAFSTSSEVAASVASGAHTGRSSTNTAAMETLASRRSMGAAFAAGAGTPVAGGPRTPLATTAMGSSGTAGLPPSGTSAAARARAGTGGTSGRTLGEPQFGASVGTRQFGSRSTVGTAAGAQWDSVRATTDDSATAEDVPASGSGGSTPTVTDKRRVPPRDPHAQRRR